MLREDVVQETSGPVGAEDPAAIVLRQQRGFRRARQVDTVTAAVVGACDGELPLGPLVDAVGQLLERDAASLREVYLPELAEMVAEGFLALGRRSRGHKRLDHSGGSGRLSP